MSDGGYLIGTRPIDHDSCVQGASGAWYPNFGQGVEVFGWAHAHNGQQPSLDLHRLAEIASERIEALNAESGEAQL